MPDKLVPAKELRGMTAPDLHGQLEKLRRDLWQLRLKAKDGSLQQTHELAAMRRQIARIHTVLNEQQVVGVNPVPRVLARGTG